MSNTIRTRIRPVHTISLDGAEAIPLRVLFGGAKGVGLLREAMKALPATLGQPEYAEARQWLGWLKQPSAAGEESFQLTLTGAQLHPQLRASGCQRVDLDLTITSRVARVRRRATYRTENALMTTAVQEGLARTCHRAINTLGAFAFTAALLRADVAGRVREKLAPRHKVTRKVEQRTAVQVTRERQIAFQRVDFAPNHSVSNF